MSLIRFSASKTGKKIRNWPGLSLCLVAVFSIPVTAVVSQDVAKEPDVELQEPADEGLVTVAGQFVNQQDQLKEFELSELKASLVQLIEIKQPQLPDSWMDMDVEQRQAWIATFEASDDGKAMIAANQKLLAEQTIIELDIESDGKFVAYDVPRGQFGLQAMAEKELDGKTYIVQAFGQINVGEVDEMQLGAMPLEVVRFLKMGELAPEISGETFSGAPASLSALQGKHVLLNFVALGNPDIEESINAIKETSLHPELKGKLSVLTISIDEDAEAVNKVIVEKSIDWPCISLGGWDVEVLNSYGVKSVPSFWLLDPEGKIVLTGQQFLFELRRTGSPLPKLVDDVIAGRIAVGGEPEDAADEDDRARSDSDDGQD